MKYFEIALPTETNDGKSYTKALRLWQDRALELAYGSTRRPDGAGEWRDPDTSVVYRDRMASFRVACDVLTFAKLVDWAFELFPDQVTFFTAEIGEAMTYARDTRSKILEEALVAAL